jgi:unsaturated rhamnogalacturonyl hydrolase
MAELLECLNGREADQSRYRDVFTRLMERAYRLKLDDGLLRTLPEDEEAYPEATSAALFGYAALKGARLGMLDGRFEAWGRQIAATLIDDFNEAGTIRLASGGTDCQERAGYLKVLYTETLYAYGTLLMLFGETLGAEPRV